MNSSLKNNEKLISKNEAENVRYRDRINDDHKSFDKSKQQFTLDNNIVNNSNKAVSRYYSTGKHSSSSTREEDYKLKNKNIAKNPQNNLIIKTDLNNNKFRSSNTALQVSLNNNTSISKNSPQINRSLVVNKVDSSLNKDSIKDRYSHMYGSN